MDLTPENRRTLYRAIMNNSNNTRGYVRHSGIRITHVEEGRAEGELTVSRDSLNRWGVVHGGCLATLADTVAGAAAFATGRGVVTLSSTFNFLRPGAGDKIHCTAETVKMGKTIAVFRCTLTDGEGRTVATGDFTFFFNGKPVDFLLNNAPEEPVD